MARHITISDFLGLNNVLPPEECTIQGDNFAIRYYLRKALNVDIDNSLKIRRRNGYASSYSGDCHSLWSDGKICLFRENRALKRLNDNLTSATILRNDIAGSLTVAYLPLNGNVYYSDGNTKGIISQETNRSWGLEIPGQVMLTAIPSIGSLREGTHQICVTYLRKDGQESGASESAYIDVADNNAVRISGIVPSSDPDVIGLRVYATKRNGELFYRAFSLRNIEQTVDLLDDGLLTAIDLKTQFLSPLPAGQIIEYYRGVVYVGAFDTVWYSEPFRYELCDLSRNFIPFSNDLTLIGAVDDGIYFGTDDEIFFAEGEGPKKFKISKVADYGAIFGTAQKLTRSNDRGTEEKFILFASARGICQGNNGGKLINSTEDTYLYEPAYSGAGFIRRDRGIRQFIVTLRGNDPDRSESVY